MSTIEGVVRRAGVTLGAAQEVLTEAVVLEPSRIPDTDRVRWRGSKLVEPGGPGTVLFAVDFEHTVHIVPTRWLVGMGRARRRACNIAGAVVDGTQWRDLPRRIGGFVAVVVQCPAGCERVEFSITTTQDRERVGDDWSWRREEILAGSPDPEMEARIRGRLFGPGEAP
jgi:hypothetical protein